MDMRIDVFTICDFAQDNNNKLTIVGTYNRILSRVFPLTYNQITVALRLSFFPGESGDKHFSCSVLDPSGNAVAVPITGTFNIGAVNELSTISAVFSFNNVAFIEAGHYSVSLDLDGAVHCTDLILSQMANQ